MSILVALLLITTEPDPPRLRYDDTRLTLERDRRELHDQWRKARSKRARNAILDRASARVLSAFRDDIFPAWIGTPWAFHGTSAKPGEGEIACGMFVGTVFEHAGFNVDRIGLGRLASEHIALTLTRARNLRRYSDVAAATVVHDVSIAGEGLYLVGLDNHAA